MLDWLVLTGQSVLEVTAGPVFTDQTVALSQVRDTLSWYPPDVERYVLAAGWQRLEQRLPFVGRTAERGDELGSRLLSGQLAGDLMSLGFALSRRWAPYGKWRGTVFATLPVAACLSGLLDAAATMGAWRDRESALAAAAETLLDVQRDRPARPGPRGRPVLGPALPRHRPAVPRLLADITDAEVARRHRDRFGRAVGSVDVLASPGRRSALQAAYLAWTGGRLGSGRGPGGRT